MKERLIDANALLDPENIHIMWPSIDHYYPSKYVVLVEDIKKAPTIDPVKHGRWVIERDMDGRVVCCYCSVCESEINYKNVYSLTPYCPYCGGKLDAGGGDTEADR